MYVTFKYCKMLLYYKLYLENTIYINKKVSQIFENWTLWGLPDEKFEI
jgi:hypothetical protein